MKWTRESAYFFGYLWSDGFIERKRTILEISEDDALDIIEDINKIDFLKINTSRRIRKNRKPQMSIYFCDVKFYDSFQKLHYIDKSNRSPIDLISEIPEDLKRYFFLGLIDGDGCFYISKDRRVKQFYVTSSYDQDWSHMISLFNILLIDQYEIRKNISKNGNRSSYIRIKKWSEIESLHNFLYPFGYEIGLKRKFNKCKLIIDNKPNRPSNKSKIDIEDLKKQINLFDDIYQLSDKFNCGWRKIHELCKKNNIKRPTGFYIKRDRY